jgi:hypothetical protein
MMDADKIDFLKRQAYRLWEVVESLELNFEAFANNEMYAKEFSDFTNRLEACLREAKAIQSAIGDKADELGGA